MANTILSTMLTPQLYSNFNNNFDRNLQSYAFFKKCGEITVSADKKYFGLNCAFCNETYLQLYVFIQHISEEHGKDIEKLYDSDKQLSCGWNVSPFISASNGSFSETSIETAATTAAAAATTNTMTTLATLLSEVDFDFLEKTEEAAELQELVYIMEDNSNNLNMVEEETVAPFHVDSNEKIPTTSTTITATVEEKGYDGDIVKTQSENKNGNSNIVQSIVAEQAIEPRSQYSEKQTQIKETQGENAANTASTKIPTEKTRSTATTTTRRAGHNREVISYLLEAYKNSAKLWDPNHPKYKYNAPRNVFNELCEPLAIDLNVKLSGVEIFNIIIGLRSRYRRELTKMKAYNNKKQSNLWYYEKMHFLRDIIENKRADRKLRNRQKPHTTTIETTEKTTNLSNKPAKAVQSKENLNCLLEAFKQREMLWNTEHEHFTNCDKLKSFEQISAQLLEEQNIEMPPNACKTEIENLISRYRKEFNALNRRKGLHVPKLWCFEQMDFIKPIFENELLKRKRRKKGIVAPKPRTRIIKADIIVFESNEDQLKFIEMYKTYPALWSCDHPDYRSTKYRDEAMNSMLKKFNEAFNIQVTVEQLDKTIANLRKSYTQEKQKLLTTTTTTTTTTTAITTNDENTSESLISNSSSSNSTSIASPTSLDTMSPQVYASLATFLEENIGPFRCDICQMIIRTSDQYKIHKSAHDGTLPFVCVICGKGFQVPGNLAIHIRRHKRDFPYSCEECHKSFATSTEVAIHQRVHTGDRPYICDLCGKTFKTWSFFDIHRRVHLNQSTFLCPICDKGFYEKNRYTAHMNGHLNIRKHSCKTCGKSFTTFANLQKHNELHLPVRKYKCEICGIRFKQFASLRWHKRKTHSTNAGCDDDSMEQ